MHLPFFASASPMAKHDSPALPLCSSSCRIFVGQLSTAACAPSGVHRLWSMLIVPVIVAKRYASAGMLAGEIGWMDLGCAGGV